MKNPPRAFYNIGPTYFKSPPGWAKGKKTGWKGETLPPGQMKKSGQGGALPPGQMKKLEQGGSLPPGQMKKFVSEPRLPNAAGRGAGPGWEPGNA